jgi:CheY-like chemotaxis protein
LKCALAEDGYQVQEAGSGKEAIEQLQQRKPDLLLLDLRMPDIDGWGVIRFLTRNPELHDIEVLVISGDSLTDRESSALQNQTSGFISKADFKVNEVLEKVANVLQVD